MPEGRKKGRTKARGENDSGKIENTHNAMLRHWKKIKNLSKIN